jgi:hypothetical protein
MLLGLIPSYAQATTTCNWDSMAGWVARENMKVGSKSWAQSIPVKMSADFSRRKTADRVEGYFSTTSLSCGESAELIIVNPPKKTTVSIFRTGYYKGKGARFISKEVIRGDWSFTPSESTPPGQYLFRLDSPGKISSFVPLIIRNPDAPSEITFVSSVLTWQSYNQWGGKSLYKGEDAKRETRASEVSFDRPYDGDGSGQVRYMELPLLKIVEKLGIDINYATDFDLDSNKELLKNTNAVLFGGHSEYWTIEMRASVEEAIANGVNLIVLGGNTAYNKTTLSLDRRSMSEIIPWRDVTVNAPESIFLGSQFLTLGIRRDLVISNPQRWPFSTLNNVTKIEGIMGYEVDSPLYSPGPGVESLGAMNILPTEKRKIAMSTYYSAPSGAGVLNMGTNGWVCAIENLCPWGYRFSKESSAVIATVTQEILRKAATPKLGETHPAIIDIPERL